MNVEMGAFWPFTDTVDQNYPEPLNCGPIAYTLFDVEGNELNSNSYVTLDMATSILAVEPTILEPVGEYSFYLRAFMVDYHLQGDRDYYVDKYFSV